MNWYEIRAKAEISEVWLYDQIGRDWFGEGTTAKAFLAELNAIKSPQIHLHINSPGGEVFDGAAIYNALRRHPASVTSFIDGIAASIASVIALAGEKIVMAANALFMLHNPNGCVMGTADDMRKTADILDKVRGTMVAAYAEKSRKPEADIVGLMDAETWLDADEAKAAGFVDEIGDAIQAAACAQFVPIMARLGYKHVPQRISAQRDFPSERDLERILRDAGCSARQAKAILAEGYSDELRDVAAAEPALQVAEPPRDVVPPPAPAGLDRTARLLQSADVIITGGTSA
jgi:ATP-dependent Clp protease protease subunit